MRNKALPGLMETIKKNSPIKEIQVPIPTSNGGGHPGGGFPSGGGTGHPTGGGGSKVVKPRGKRRR